MKYLHRVKFRLLVISALFSIVCLGFACSPRLKPTSASVGYSQPLSRVNVPNLSSGPFEPAVFWFGQVTPTKNHADVRMWYYEPHIELTLHIIDRQIWHDTSPSTASLEEWDAVTLYMDLDGNQGNAPDNNSYRLVIQFGASETDKSYQVSYLGNGSNWVAAPISFTADSIYRGEGGPNTDFDNKGWQLTVVIPFTSLGLSDPPPSGTVWGLGYALHDRDDSSGTYINDQVWPEQMDPSKPATWGQLYFGRAQYIKSNLQPQGTTTIQGGFNGAVVPDAHVGGNFTCGDGLDHWSEWGEANYTGSNQINIQNQWDISDYPCFSKYFVTFPLDSIPAGKVVVFANLRMTMFGNSGGGQWGEPPDSYIQAFTINDPWNESTLNWNNAPLAFENLSGTWVKPTQTSNQREYFWDVSKAVAEAYQSGGPVRLALYSADGERHTGKYFWSSDSNDWGGSVRPALQVTWGAVCNSEDVECHYTYLPIITN